MPTGRIGTRYISTAHHCADTHCKLALLHPLVHHPFAVLDIHRMSPQYSRSVTASAHCNQWLASTHLSTCIVYTLPHTFYALIHSSVQCFLPMPSIPLRPFLPPSVPPCFLPSLLPSCLPSCRYTPALILSNFDPLPVNQSPITSL